MARECPVCFGKGYLPKDTMHVPSDKNDVCPWCKGIGQVV